MTWYRNAARSLSHPLADVHELYGGRMYVGMKPRMLRSAISFLIISSCRRAEVTALRSACDHVCEAIWWFSVCMRLTIVGKLRG